MSGATPKQVRNSIFGSFFLMFAKIAPLLKILNSEATAPSDAQDNTSETGAENPTPEQPTQQPTVTQQEDIPIGEEIHDWDLELAEAENFLGSWE